MTDYLTLNFLIYLFRWVVSAIVMAFPLYLLIRIKCCESNKYSEYIHLLIVQIIGAFIFYNIDKLILSD